MRQIAVCVVLVLFLCLQFLIYGVAANKILKLKMKLYETEIIGFFVHFGLFQIIALPLILLQKSLTLLMLVWIAVSVISAAYVLLAARKELGHALKGICSGVWNMKGFLLLGAVTITALACYYFAVQKYMGWDTTYYVGTVNTSIYTDTMYIYNGSSGAMESKLDLRYALSGFYMHSAVLCRVFSLNAMEVQKYVMGILCILLYGMLVFAIGKKLFQESSKSALGLVITAFLLNFGFHTMYTSSSFLLVRAYEAKGYCANVIMPALFYMVLCFWKKRKDRTYWWMLFLIAFASVPVSMSALVIAPAVIAIMLLTEWILEKDAVLLWRGFWCLVPNGIYLLVYFLYTRGMIITIG